MTEARQDCELPKWRATKKGTNRCGQVCSDAHGRRRFRWTKRGECSGQPEPPPRSKEQEEVTEFSSGALDMAGMIAGALGVPPVRLEPMPLVPLVGLSDGIAKRRSVAGRRRKEP